MTQVDAFFGKCMRELMNYGVSIQFISEEISNINYSFFETDNKHENPRLILSYADGYHLTNFQVFLHEYCHFLQWKNNTPSYINSNSALLKFNKWLAYKNEKISIKDIRKIQEMELDCDKRAVRIIQEHKFPIDLIRYKKLSNSYILSYNYVFETRNFFHDSGFDNPDVLNSLPDRFLSMKEINKGIPKHKELFIKYSK